MTEKMDHDLAMASLKRRRTSIMRQVDALKSLAQKNINQITMAMGNLDPDAYMEASRLIYDCKAIIRALGTIKTHHLRTLCREGIFKPLTNSVRKVA